MAKGSERVFGFWEAPPLIADLISTLSGRSRALLGLSTTAFTTGDLVELSELLLSRRGEVSGAILAETLLEAYGRASDGERDIFMRALLNRFGPDQEKLAAATEAYMEKPDAANAGRLHSAAEPRRQELFRRINTAQHGTSTLVRMREHLLDMLRREPELRPVDDDFCHLLSSWFNRGFLSMRTIDWNTSASILEALIRYEAVHEINGWDDLRRRLQPEDRRCFGFFHPQMADEPLIFVEVALTDHIASSVNALLAEDRKPIPASQATTAVFYSISNCQRGLTGVSLGNFLIKQVVADLKRELPRLENFVTLSPMPGFAAWVNSDEAEQGEEGLLAAKRELRAMLADREWPNADKARLAEIQSAFLPLAAHYLIDAKRKDGRPADSVARFHLGNGAQVERLNFLGDRSPRGMRQAYGVMVNYRYRPGEIEKNHETYAETGQVAASPALRKLAQQIRMEVN